MKRVATVMTTKLITTTEILFITQDKSQMHSENEHKSCDTMYFHKLIPGFWGNLMTKSSGFPTFHGRAPFWGLQQI